jgi:hypothetical protein
MKQPITNESGERDGRKDFDFLIGNWNIQHRRLKERQKECTEWEEFEAPVRCGPSSADLATWTN